LKVIHKTGNFIALFFVLFTILAVSPAVADETGETEIQTGVIALKDFNYPVHVYIPQGMKPDRKYPMLMSLPKFGESTEQNIENWKGLANRKMMVILSPEFLDPRETPYDYDRWLMQVKAVVTQMFPVNPTKVYLIGNESSASYAAYLAVNNPEDFSAVALLGGSWLGRFEKLMVLGTRPSRQLPIYVVFKPDQEQLFKDSEVKALAFSSRGYPIKLVQADPKQEYMSLEFKKELLDWLDQRSQEWAGVIVRNNKTFKEKTRRYFRDFFLITRK